MNRSLSYYHRNKISNGRVSNVHTSHLTEYSTTKILYTQAGKLGFERQRKQNKYEIKDLNYKENYQSIFLYNTLKCIESFNRNMGFPLKTWDSWTQGICLHSQPDHYTKTNPTRKLTEKVKGT